MYKKQNDLRKAILCVLDCLIALASFWIAGMIRYDDLAQFQINIDAPEAMFLLLCLVVLLFFVLKIQDRFQERGYLVELGKVLQMNVGLFVGLTAYSFVTKNAFTLSRLTLAYFLVANTVLDCAAHYILKYIYRKGLAKRGLLSRQLMLMVTQDGALEAVRSVQRLNDSRYQLSGVVLLDGLQNAPGTVQDVPVVAGLDEYLPVFTTHVVDEVLLIPGNMRHQEDILRRVICDLEEMGIVVNMQIETIDTGVSDVKQIYKLGEYHVVAFSTRLYDARLLFVKRLMDIAGGIVGLLLTLLISVFLAPAILLESPGPLLFSQQRVGRNGRVFRMYKFRSMHRDAEARRAELMDQNEMQGPLFKIKDDPRITRVGAFIRRTSLDEFPQFWNVLKGDMSLVGTRPPTLDEYSQYTHQQKRRLSFKPGLSGLWQISGRNDISDFDEVIRMDLEYIDNWSIALDVKILAKTIGVMVGGKGR